MNKGRPIDIDDAKHLLHVYHSFNKQYNYPTNKADQDDIHKMVADELNKPENSNNGDIHIDSNFVKDFLRKIDQINGVDIFVNSAVENVISGLENSHFGLSPSNHTLIKDAISSILTSLTDEYFSTGDYRNTFKDISSKINGAIKNLLGSMVSLDTLNNIYVFVDGIFLVETVEYERTISGDMPIVNVEKLRKDYRNIIDELFTHESGASIDNKPISKRTWMDFCKSFGKHFGFFLTPEELEKWYADMAESKLVPDRNNTSNESSDRDTTTHNDRSMSQENQPHTTQSIDNYLRSGYKKDKDFHQMVAARDAKDRVAAAEAKAADEAADEAKAKAADEAADEAKAKAADEAAAAKAAEAKYRHSANTISTFVTQNGKANSDKFDKNTGERIDVIGPLNINEEIKQVNELVSKKGGKGSKCRTHRRRRHRRHRRRTSRR